MMSFLKNVLDNDLIFSLKVRGTFVMFVCLDAFKKGIQQIWSVSTAWPIMVVRVVEFSSGGKKLESILPKSQHAQRKFLNFEN